MEQSQQQPDSPSRKEPPVIDVFAPHHELGSRVSAVAVSPNLIYAGTTTGEIRAFGRVDGTFVDKTWTQENRTIEGVMFDFAGKLVYATEMNLVVVDRAFKNILKEYRSHDPLRNRNLTSSHAPDW